MIPVQPVATELPIAERAQAIARAVSENPVTLVIGATGSGKSTQLAKICLGAGRGAGAMIGHTQPRRIAARRVAARIASELGTGLGRLVGYQVRFRRHTASATRIKLMTESGARAGLIEASSPPLIRSSQRISSPDVSPVPHIDPRSSCAACAS